MLALSRKHSLLTAMAMAIASVNISKPPQTKIDPYLRPVHYDNQEPQPPEFEPSKQPKPEPTSKWWVRSKTVWFNVGVTLLGVVSALFPIADSVMPFAKPYISPETFAVLTAIIGAGNVILRAKTQAKLTNQANADTTANDGINNIDNSTANDIPPPDSFTNTTPNE